MSFSHADVQNIIQLLDASHFDELVLEMDGIKLQLRRGGAPGPAATPTAALGKTPSAQPASSAIPASSATAATAARTTTTGVNAASAPVSAPTTVQSATDNSTVQEIRAPMLGTFYSAPKPGAAPFVAVGDRVEADTVVGIIEVMKLMNSTSAGVSGEIIEILVKDGDLVEYEQPLMRVRA